MGQIALPNTWANYTRDVVTRSELLIERGIWNGIQTSSLEGWLKNFETAEQKYLAACLLDNFVYKSNQQIVSMYKYLFNVLLPNFCKKTGRKNIIKPGNAYFAPLDSGIPGRSEHLYFRLLSQSIGIPKSQRKNLTRAFLDTAPKSPIVLIDDFCGTGDSFETFAKNSSIALYPQLDFIFCPLVAHEAGINRVAKDYKNVRVVPVERISKSFGTFASPSDVFSNPESAKDFYLEYVKEKGIGDSKFPLGYGNQQLALAFEYSVPNETLPVFWCNKMTTPLVRRNRD